MTTQSVVPIKHEVSFIKKLEFMQQQINNFKINTITRLQFLQNIPRKTFSFQNKYKFD